MSEIRGNKVSFDPSKIVLTAGATSANETLTFCLAEAGDAILLPTPYYPGYVLNFLSKSRLGFVQYPVLKSYIYRMIM